MIESGTLLQNRYRVVQQVGKGGMGEVYLALDERFQSRVAIKRTFYDDPEMRKAFRREARLLNHLRHAALPKVSDHFSEGDGQFLVMEFIEGFDFAELLTRRKVPFPLADVLRWADELLDALDYLHTQEPPVVHRDIKPPNIKLTPRGKVMLLDFGLAKGAPAQTASVTASSVLGYSLNFAPLEQMQASGTDQRSDLYSLAATLYSLLTGVRPPDAVTRAAAAIKEQPDPLRPANVVQPQVPAVVGQILQRAMSLNPAFRPASAAEMRAALRQAGNDAAAAPSVGSPVRPKKSVEPAPQVPDQPATPSQTINSHSTASAKDVTLLDSPRRPRFSDPYKVSAQAAPPVRVAAGKRTFGLVACLLVVCVAVGAYLFVPASSSRLPAANEAQTSAPPSQQIVPAGTTTPAASTVAPDSSNAASGPNASAQSAPARSTGETPVSHPQPAAEAVTVPDQSGPNAKTVSATPDNANAAASPAGRPTLVIQNPTPANGYADASRRAEEARREQPASHPEYTNGPPPGSFPPPPGDRRLPPPDGRRPPPNFRPRYP